LITRTTAIALPLILLLAVAFSGNSYADESPVSNDALIDQVSQEVIRRLIEDGALDEQIKLGIDRYIDKQQQAQSRAEEQARASATTLATTVRRISPERDHIYGNPDAPVSLIEYSDFECPFCKRFHPNSKDLDDNSDGQVNWIYRHFPLEFHNPLAQLEAEASECAGELGGNDTFWTYADLLYERTKSNGNGLSSDALVPFAQEVGLDEKDFKTCLESGRMTARVQEDVVSRGANRRESASECRDLFLTRFCLQSYTRQCTIPAIITTLHFCHRAVESCLGNCAHATVHPLEYRHPG
jgi:protein-disulfide isomerase